jgi:hypothetical protein
MNAINEHDRVVLTASVAGEKLAAGDVGGRDKSLKSVRRQVL